MHVCHNMIFVSYRQCFDKVGAKVQQGLLVSCLWDREAQIHKKTQIDHRQALAGECDVINNVADLCEDEIGQAQRFLPANCDKTKSKQ